MSEPFNRREIYRVRSDEDPTALIGLDVKLEDGHLSWFDTGRDRGHRIVKTSGDGSDTVYETETGFHYRFEPLTKEIYDREVKALVELSPDFESTDEIRRFYYEKFLGIELE